MNLSRKHIGLWYDPTKNGQGVSVITYPDGTTFLMWHLAPIAGLSDAPVWLSAQRRGDEPPNELTLFRTEFGGADAPQFLAVGRCEVHSESNDRISARLIVDFASGFSPPPPAVELYFDLYPLFRESVQWA